MNPPLPPDDDDALAQRLAQALHALPDAPPAWVAAATALWSSPAAQPLLQAAFPTPAAAAETGAEGWRPPARPAGWQRWAAALVFDSLAPGGPLLAMRGSAPAGGGRHLLYRVAGRDIDLRVHGADGVYSLSGQLLGPEEPGWLWVQPWPAEAALVPAPVLAAQRVALDDLGGFVLGGLPAGAYQLTLSLQQEDLVLPPLQLGDDTAPPTV